jgi:hypothetical protein
MTTPSVLPFFSAPPLIETRRSAASTTNAMIQPTRKIPRTRWPGVSVFAMRK